MIVSIIFYKERNVDATLDGHKTLQYMPLAVWI